MEKELNSVYIRRRRPNKLVSEAESCYYCHRWSSFKNMESQDSKKIDGCCPSSIDVFATKDEVEITFWKTHCGHTNEENSSTQTKQRSIAEFYSSTKKPRSKSEVRLNKPSHNEQASIVDSLLTSNEVTNVHCGFDHSYDC